MSSEDVESILWHRGHAQVPLLCECTEFEIDYIFFNLNIQDRIEK